MLLIVSWNPLVDPPSALLAATQFKFSQFPNIDEVYFEAAEGHFSPVFNRADVGRLDAAAVETGDLARPDFLRLVEARFVEKDEPTFRIVQRLTELAGNVEWMSRDGVGTLVMYAEKAIEAGRLEDGWWVIRRLQNSPDKSIRALLCWSLSKLASLNDFGMYPDILTIVEGYAVDEDDDLRANAVIPLGEMTRRRFAMNTNRTWIIEEPLRGRIKTLAFAMLPTARGEVADRLTRAFFYLRDISSQEALQVVQTLAEHVDGQGLHDISVLLLYFAIYRHNHFGEMGAFDSAPLQGLLQRSLQAGTDSLRASLIWTINKGLEDEMQIEDVLPYLRFVVAGTYERSTFSQLYRIIKKQFAAGHEMCELFLAAVNREVEWLLANDVRQLWHFNDFFDCVRMSKQQCGETFRRIRELLLQVPDRLGAHRNYVEQLVAREPIPG
jgi:hypothetical protein